MFGNVGQCFAMSVNVPQCLPMLRNVCQCFAMLVRVHAMLAFSFGKLANADGMRRNAGRLFRNAGSVLRNAAVFSVMLANAGRHRSLSPSEAALAHVASTVGLAVPGEGSRGAPTALYGSVEAPSI